MEKVNHTTIIIAIVALVAIVVIAIFGFQKNQFSSAERVEAAEGEEAIAGEAFKKLELAPAVLLRQYKLVCEKVSTNLAVDDGFTNGLDFCNSRGYNSCVDAYVSQWYNQDSDNVGSLLAPTNCYDSKV